MDRVTSFAVAALAALAAALGTPAAAQQPARGTTPKVVLQSQPPAIEVAAWMPNGAQIVTAIGITREVFIVEADSGRIVDRLVVPAAKGAREDAPRYTALTIAPDGSRARLEGVVSDFAAGEAALPRAWDIDLWERTIRPAAPAAKATAADDPEAWLAAIVTMHEGGRSMSADAATRLLPKLPNSPDGKLRLVRSTEGLEIRPAAGGGEAVTAGATTAFQIADAALAPDGRRLAIVFDYKDADEEGRRIGTDVAIYDLLNATFARPISLEGNYGAVTWLDAGRFVVTADTQSNDRGSDDIDDQGPPSPTRIIDAATGKTLRTIPPACYVTPLSGGAFVGSVAADCRSNAGTRTGALRFDPASGQWRPFPGDLGEMSAKLRIDLIAVSPDLARIAVGFDVPAELNEGKAAKTVALFDAVTGAALSDDSFDSEGAINAIAFSPDGRSLFAATAVLQRWDYAAGNVVDLPTISLAPSLFATNGRELIAASALDAEIGRMELAGARPMPPLDLGNAVDGGFIAGKPLFWAVSAGGTLKLWDTRSWRPVISTWFFAEQRFLAVAEDGRYDTNLRPDDAPFTWLMADDPWVPLGPQTFMRDYYAPRLTEKLLRCTQAGDCGKVLPSLPPIAGLNRVLPAVEIVSITPGETPDWAVVTVEVSEGRDDEPANRKTRSGLYDLRLLRDGRVVARSPEPVPGEPPPRTLADWRKVHRVAEAGTGKPATLTFEVPLPTGASAGEIEFSAYAYNEDRVKSDTARLTYDRPRVTPRKPRAYVLTIGVDHYDEARLKLNFASADARLIGERLATVPGHEVRRLSLIGERTPGGGRRVTADMVRAALVALNGAADVNDAELKALLEGADLSAFEGATPDDLVIISFSGHGWASPSGEFYLVPADAKWPLGAALPDAETLISAEELTLWLGFIDARETIFIIDACHSGASVETAGFKPGPMGDPGLGQLAFDKGIRILAAAQGDELAQENPRLGQGLLTYALAAEGIDGEGFGRADLDRDGRILIEEWLRYPTTRLTSLSAEARAGGVAPVPMTRNFAPFNPGTTAPPKVQEPALFDFTDKPSGIALREGKGRAQ